MTNKIVLVTGAYGFLGRHVARFYAQHGWHVVGIGHGDWAREEWERWGIAEWHACDVAIDTLQTYAGEPDTIVHCAGSGSVSFSMTRPVQDFHKTVETTLSVLEFVRLYARSAKVVYPSSAAVYGVADKFPITEDSLLRPVSPYGVHKKIAEELCQSYSRHFGVSTSVVRFFSIYGNGLRKQVLWDACTKISRNEITFFGAGIEMRDWLHIDDASELLFIAGKHASPDCPIVNGGYGIGIPVREVLTEIFACFQRTDLPVFTGNVRSGDPMHYVADITLTQAWGWSPRTDWRSGVREYVQWFKKILCREFIK